MITIKKQSPGEFTVLSDGEPTEWSIVNGSHGLSGRDTRNMYGIVNSKTGQVRWIGPLHSAKQIATQLAQRGCGPKCQAA